MALWQYEEAAGDWRDIDAEASKQVEAEYVHLKGEGKVDVEAGGQCYNVCFKRFLQVNIVTKKVRNVRRVWGAPVWRWKGDAGSWEDYNTLQAKKIEENFKDSTVFELRLTPTKKVTIDLKKLVQVNEATGKERAIVRTVVMKELPSDRILSPDGVPVFFKRTIEAISDIPLDETIVSQPPATTWEWKTDKKNWVAYDAGTTAVLEKAFQNGDKKIDVVTKGGLQLSMDLEKMSQYREETDGARKIRRVGGDCSPPTSPQKPVAKKPKKTGKKHSTTVVNNWEASGSALVLPGNVSGGDVVIGFDMDDTLITTKSGRVHPANAADWKWLHPSVKPTLTKLNESGAKIVIFSNQGGIGGVKGHTNQKAKDIKAKLLDVSKDLGFSLQAFVSTTQDRFRKPYFGMWQLMAEEYNDGITPDLTQCIYVGDAAGRTIRTMGKKAKDFSCGDRKFAENIGVKFATPEGFFLGENEAPFIWGTGFNPKTHEYPKYETKNAADIHPAKHQEVVVMVGFPGSGKSSFAKKYFVSQNYVHVNRDTLKTAAKCLKLLKESLSQGKSVIVDNTNPKPETRKEIASIASSHKVPTRCFHMTTSYELSRHLNVYREAASKGAVPHVPTIAFNMYKSGFVKPSVKDGFASVTDVSFVPKFKSPEEKKLFNSWLLSE